MREKLPASRSRRLASTPLGDDDMVTPVHWKRRRPTWPYFAVLLSLFALTLLAPQSWRRRPSGAPAGEDVARWQPELPLHTHAAPEPAGTPIEWSSPAPESAEPTPALPPLAPPNPVVPEPTFAGPEVFQPTPAGPSVASDDYVAVDDPLVDPAPESVLPTTDEPPAPPSAVAESFAQRPGGRSVIVRSVPAPQATARPNINVEALRKVRDSLMTWVEQARQMSAAAQATAEAATATPVTPPSHRVMVESSDDRLAMVPDLAEPPTPADAAPALPPVEMPVEPAPTPAPPAVAPPALKHRPATLFAQLDALQPDTAGGAWAEEVRLQLEPLISQPAGDAPAWGALSKLHRLATDGAVAATKVADPAEQSAWIRAVGALERRLPVWDLLLDPATKSLVDGHEQEANAVAVLESVHESAAATAGASEGAAWRDYLRLDDLAGLTSVGGDNFQDARRATAREVLLRMVDPRLTPDQVAFLAQPPIAGLARALRPWASGTISLDALSALIERYEATSSEGDAANIAELRLRMKWSADERLSKLGDHLNRSYRNGNVRVALSHDFINRLVPEQKPVVSRVVDQISGTEVHGKSKTESEVHLRLLADPSVWRIGLEAQGTVQSRTYSDVGAAHVHNASRMQYEARKLIVINRFGLHVWPAEAKVQGHNDLVGIDSHLGPVPVVGPLVDEMIRETHHAHEAEALAVVRAKIKREACKRMDREADAKLGSLEERFKSGLSGPMERLAISAEPVEMATTEDRLVMRVRLGDEPQLAAHTPRPSAPSDSFVSVQVHESALNNALEGLSLDGKRMTVGELHKLLGEKIVRHATEAPADLPDRAIVEFAKHDAVRVRCHEDCVELVIGIVELRKGRDSIHNVGVHAFFRPVVDGLEVKMVRDGTLQFEGAHLRTGPRMVLHSVFNKMLRKDEPVPLLANKLGDDPRFAGLMVTQLVIDDGWVALSLGPATPQRTAWRTRATVVR